MVCGHCHGQRIPEPTDRIQSILSQGDPFNAGEDLAQFYRPIDRDARSVNWSITEAKRIWPEHFAQAQPSADEQFNLPEGPRALFAGDALTRALAADLMSGNGPTRPDPRWASPFLVEAFTDNIRSCAFLRRMG
ncbi:MAG TPA: hypothetical protein VGN90_17870 [Pyrinomonadaceae bacterium]|jgi:hypothetical protein|nr:hypothetical protein [Pyrinomonadaceae bacterium]